MLSSLMDAMRASASILSPFPRSLSPPGWKAFSIATAAPTTSAHAGPTMSHRPSKAAPFARKSSTISTLSPGFR